jgi:hypothetical protein
MVAATQPSGPQVFIREVNQQDIQLAGAIAKVVNDAYRSGKAYRSRPVNSKTPLFNLHL